MSKADLKLDVLHCVTSGRRLPIQTDHAKKSETAAGRKNTTVIVAAPKWFESFMSKRHFIIYQGGMDAVQKATAPA